MYFMFYAAWKNAFIGNINVAVSNDLLKWKKIKQNIFKLNKAISIVSEPFLLEKGKKIYLFFEYKKNLIWNISFKKFSYNKFETIVGSKK